MKTDLRGSKRSALAALIVAILMSLAGWNTVPLFKRLDLAVFDSFQRASPRTYDPDTPVRIVAIDREALEKFGQWPWPRPVLAELVNRLTDLGAAAIGFDIVFAEPDRTSPEEIARSLAAATGRSATIADGGPSHDATFASAIAGAPVILATIPTNTKTGGTPPVKARASWLGENATPALTEFTGADVNRDVLSAAASGIGSIALTPDDRQDGIIRRIALTVRRGEIEIPALTLEMLRVAQGARGYLMKGVSVNDALSVTSVRAGAVEIETAADAGAWVRYAGQQPRRTLSAALIFSGDDALLRNEIEGRLILIGATAPALGDIKATPMNLTVPGVEVHAEILEQIFAGEALTRPDTMPGLERFSALLIGAVIALGFLFIGFFGGTIAAVGLMIAAPTVSFFMFRDQGVLFGPSIPVAAGFFAWSAGGLVDYFGARKERVEIRRQFEHFVAPDVIAEIAQDPDKHMTPGGEERDLTILFADVRSFSTISAGLTPQELIEWLNSYLTPMTEAILEEKGTIDKFIGDAIMAFWNAPRREDEHAKQAMRGALAMSEAMDNLNESFRQANRPAAKFGIGLNTGPCSVGRIGARKRLDYTCIGDAVNVASRVEGLTKMYDTKILVGEDSARGARDFALVEIDRVEVKGREGVPLDIFALLGDDQFCKTESFQKTKADWDGALTSYRERLFKKAADEFSGLLNGPLDGPAKTFLQRIPALIDFPPGDNWDAVFRAETK